MRTCLLELIFLHLLKGNVNAYFFTQTEVESPEFVVLWCKLVADKNSPNFPVIIDVMGYVDDLQSLVKKAAFKHESEITEPYRDVADLLSETPGVNEIAKSIKDITCIGASNLYLTPFVVLQNSSGTGKTQMAFNLMARKDVEVFYICHGDVQKVFSLRSESFFNVWRKIYHTWMMP